jgi:hypothetical protein
MPRIRPLTTLALAALTAALAPVAPGASAAGTGEFCGPGWQKVTTPTVQRFSALADLDGAPGDLWAVGTHHRSGGPDATLALHWDGSSWTEVASVDAGSASRFEGVASIAADDVWAVGSAEQPDARLLAEHWNGAVWTSVPMPDVAGGDDELWAVDAAAPDDVWAVGRRGSSVVRTVTAHWNGSSWSVVTSPSPGAALNILYGVDAVSSTQAWAFGVRGDSTTDVSPLVMRWNGSSWSVVADTAGVPAGMYLEAGTVAPGGDVWTAGGTWSFPGGPTGLAQRRQGSTWTSWPSSEARWTGVGAASSTDVWLSGENDRGAPTAHWDGASWTTLPTPPGREDTAAPTLRAIDIASADEIWTVGSVDVPGGTSTPGSTTLGLRLCPLDVTDAGISKPSSRVSQGSGTLWRFPAGNHGSHDVTEALGLAGNGTPLFGTGSRPAGSTGTFVLDDAGTFPVVDTTTGHTSELTIPTEAAPKRAALGTRFQIFTSSLATLPTPLGTDIRYRKPGSEFWYRLVTATPNGTTSFTPTQTGTYTIQARLRNKVTGRMSGWSPFAMISVTP